MPIQQALYIETSSASGTLNITTGSLAGAVVGTPYTQSLAATGGTGSGYLWNIVSCTPNSGLWLKLISGTLQGTPQQNEIESITAQVTDSGGNTAQATFSLAVTVTGSLAIVTSAGALPGAFPLNGYGAYQLIAEGGVPPYTWSGISYQPNQLTGDGWLMGTPTATTTISGTAVVTDSAGATASIAITMAVNSTLTINGIDSTFGLVELGHASVNSAYIQYVTAYGGTGTGYTYTVLSGSLPAGLSLASSGKITGTPTRSGSQSAVIRVTDSGSNTATATVYISVKSNSIVARPSYNSTVANGLFVLGSQLYDKNGNPVQMRGLDRDHFNSTAWASNTNGALTRMNACRMFFNSYDNPAQQLTMLQTGTADFTNNGIIGIISLNSVPHSLVNATVGPGSAFTVNSPPTFGSVVVGATNTGDLIFPQGASIGYGPTISSQSSGTTGGQGVYVLNQSSSNTSTSTLFTFKGTSGGNSTSGSTSTTDLQNCGKWWVEMASQLTPFNQYIICNIANEWGVSGSVSGSTWASNYNTIVTNMRAAGYTGPLMIDALSFGQDIPDVLTYGPSIVANDPLQNVVFDFHMYGTGHVAAPITGITINSSTSITVKVGVVAGSNPYGGGLETCYLVGIAGSLGSLLNGQTGTITATGGSSGAWTVTLTVASESYPAWVSGGTCYDGAQYLIRAQAIAACQAEGLCCFVGEYCGPGINGVSASVGQITAAYDAYGISYNMWAWDDGGNNGPWTQPGGGSFQLTIAGPGNYSLTDAANLTEWGMDIVLHPRYGVSLKSVLAPTV